MASKAAVDPGPTATPLFMDGKPQDVIDHLTSQAPLERLGQPGDIAEEVFRIGDRVRRDFYRNLGFGELLKPM